MAPGVFVRVLFPTLEKPRRPGLLHIGYVLGSTPAGALVAYTTSAALNQSRAFVIRLGAG